MCVSVESRVARSAARTPTMVLPLLLIAAAALAASGCGKPQDGQVPLFPVKGQISWEGGPIPGALVVLHPVGTLSAGVPAPRGQVDQNGKFSLTTFKAGDGAPAGEYVVTVQWQRVVGKGDDAQVTPNVLSPKYSDPRTSDLRVRVAEGANDLAPILLRR